MLTGRQFDAAVQAEFIPLDKMGEQAITAFMGGNCHCPRDIRNDQGFRRVGALLEQYVPDAADLFIAECETVYSCACMLIKLGATPQTFGEIASHFFQA